MQKLLVVLVIGISITGCNPIIEQSERDQREEQLQRTQDRDAQREAITGVPADR